MKVRVRAALLASALVGSSLGFVLAASPASAATIPVTTTTDGVPGSLRDVLANDATNAAGDVVVLAAGATYTLTCGAGGQLVHGDTPLTIQGNGATITMEIGCNARILDNGAGALVLDGVKISGVDTTFNASITGALIQTGSTVKLMGGSALTGNTVTNTNGDVEGLVAPFSGPIVVEDSTFSANTVTVTGGAFWSIFRADVEISGSTVSNNTATVTGTDSAFGLIANGSAIVTDTTVAQNSVTGGGVVFSVFNGDCTLTNTTIDGTTVHAAEDVFGGLCDGAATLTNSSVTNTTVTSDADAAFGGMFEKGCSLTDSLIDSTTVTADHVFGGICDGSGTLVRSTISRTSVTTVTTLYGALFNEDATVTNSTLSANTWDVGDTLDGGLAEGSLTLVYATVTDNDSPVVDEGVGLTTFGSVIAGSIGGPNCQSPTTTSHGYNLSDDASCDLTSSTDTQGADPDLGPLGSNGGVGLTQVPQETSPLIDAILTTSCQADGATGITTDERGVTRPQRSGCDIGAVEVEPPPPPSPSPTPVPVPVPTPASVLFITPRFTG